MATKGPVVQLASNLGVENHIRKRNFNVKHFSRLRYEQYVLQNVLQTNFQLQFLQWKWLYLLQSLCLSSLFYQGPIKNNSAFVPAKVLVPIRQQAIIWTNAGPFYWCMYVSLGYDNMMTSSNGNIFRVTGHLCGKFTGPRWISRTKASDAELWCFLWLTPE